MTENGRAATDHAGRVREMFANIAARYDLLNHLLSANVDRRWRRLVSRRVQNLLSPTGERKILDLACGTGDLAQALFETTGARVVASDFCRPMLSIAAGKVDRSIVLVEGDALKLAFGECSFDVVAIGFGLRNFASVEEGLKEVQRVLKPGGWLAVLEFSKPVNPLLRFVFEFYFIRILPLMGGLVSGSLSAYTYLPNSVKRFPDQRALAGLMELAGFTQVHYENLTGGIAALHLGRRPN